MKTQLKDHDHHVLYELEALDHADILGQLWRDEYHNDPEIMLEADRMFDEED